jgi:hypothetical protein
VRGRGRAISGRAAVSFGSVSSVGREESVTVDPSRIAASVVTGIGFLGGGAILRTGVGVQGLTTAAGMWLVGSIGLAAGSGMYVLSALSTVLGVVALTVLRRFEHKDDTVLRRRISITLTEEAPVLSDLLGALRGSASSSSRSSRRCRASSASASSRWADALGGTRPPTKQAELAAFCCEVLSERQCRSGRPGRVATVDLRPLGSPRPVSLRAVRGRGAHDVRAWLGSR